LGEKAVKRGTESSLGCGWKIASSSTFSVTHLTAFLQNKRHHKLIGWSSQFTNSNLEFFENKNKEPLGFPTTFMMLLYLSIWLNENSTTIFIKL